VKERKTLISRARIIAKPEIFFQARLEKMNRDLLESGKVDENKVYMASAIVGELGNNSFDHNIGNWRDIPGTFFGYDFYSNDLLIVLADRGQGVWATLKNVKSKLKDDREALNIAFTEIISGRSLEARGNELKFVRQSVKELNFHLDFYSGEAKAELNEKFSVVDSEKK
jgi:DNA-dependent RNA polymerase auxiliary subunit epsilon